MAVTLDRTVVVMVNRRESYDAGREALRRARGGGSAAHQKAMARYLETEAYRARHEDRETEPGPKARQDDERPDEERPDGED